MRQPPDMSLVALWIMVSVKPRAWRSRGPDLEGVGIDLVESIDGFQSPSSGPKFSMMYSSSFWRRTISFLSSSTTVWAGSVRGLGLAKVVEVDVIRDGHLALGEALEEVGLAAAVLAEEAVSAQVVVSMSQSLMNCGSSPLSKLLILMSREVGRDARLPVTGAEALW